MTKRESRVISAYTGILLCDINEFRQFLSDEDVPDPLMSFTPEMAKSAFDELKKIYHDEFHEIIRNRTDQEGGMTIKRLKELEESLARAYSISGDPDLVDVDEHAECYGDIQKLIEREIERQSVTDKDIKEAIDYYEQVNAVFSTEVNDLLKVIKKYPWEKMGHHLEGSEDWRPSKVASLECKIQRNQLAIEALKVYQSAQESESQYKLLLKYADQPTMRSAT